MAKSLLKNSHCLLDSNTCIVRIISQRKLPAINNIDVEMHVYDIDPIMEPCQRFFSTLDWIRLYCWPHIGFEPILEQIYPVFCGWLKWVKSRQDNIVCVDQRAVCMGECSHAIKATRSSSKMCNCHRFHDGT